jgi:hypothetical protein
MSSPRWEGDKDHKFPRYITLYEQSHQLMHFLLTTITSRQMFRRLMLPSSGDTHCEGRCTVKTISSSYNVMFSLLYHTDGETLNKVNGIVTHLIRTRIFTAIFYKKSLSCKVHEECNAVLLSSQSVTVTQLCAPTHFLYGNWSKGPFSRQYDM